MSSLPPLSSDLAIALYTYCSGLGSDRTGAIDALYEILLYEVRRQQLALIEFRFGHLGLGGVDEYAQRKALSLSMVASNWPTKARKNGHVCSSRVRMGEIATICVDETRAKKYTYKRIAAELGVHPQKVKDTWAVVVKFARAEIAAAITLHTKPQSSSHGQKRERLHLKLKQEP